MIHKTAVIDPKAELGTGVTVGPFTCIEGSVKIGDGCHLGAHVSILKHTALGRNCSVHAGAVLGGIPQDKSFEDVLSRVEIGDNCIIREGVTIHRGTKPETATRIGEGSFLMAFSHFAHNVKVGRGVTVANGALLAGYVEVEDGAFISGNVSIHQFVRIGRLAMLGGNCAVSKDVPPFSMIRPVSLNTVGGLNVIGMRRSGLTPKEREDVRQAFKLLYHSGLNVTQAAQEIKDTFISGPAREFCHFIEQSKRGLCGIGGDE